MKMKVKKFLWSCKYGNLSTHDRCNAFFNMCLLLTAAAMNRTSDGDSLVFERNHG
jgi:hypothetical protein